MTQVYYAAISKEIHPFLIQNYLPDFSRSFQNKVLKYRRWQDAQLSLLGRLLLKYGFEKNNEVFVDKDLVFTKNKKPLFKDHRIKFNISHSGDIVICVLTDVSEVGIDIEVVKEVDVNDFKNHMTENEWTTINNTNSINKAFFQYWTQKEAVLKAHGDGLSIPLQSFEVNCNYSRLGDDVFFLKELQVKNNYNCHVAFRNKTDNAILHPKKVSIFSEKTGKSNLI